MDPTAAAISVRFPSLSLSFSLANLSNLSKAFDSVDHDALLTKLPWYGITDVSWFSSYLSNRRQTVRGGDVTLPVTCGVPQGSIIGPILFIVFTSDLPAHLTHGCLISYADDTLHIDSASPNRTGPCRTPNEAGAHHARASCLVRSKFSENEQRQN